MACSMLAAGGALFAGEVRLSGDKYFTDMSTYDQAISDGIVKNDTAFAAIGVTIHWAMTVVGVFVGAALVVLALLAFFGQSWARAVSWIFGLPVLLWYGGLASLYILGHVLTGDVQAAGPAELDRRFDAAWPSWLNTFDVLLMAAVAVLLIAALVCQTVPAADRYFRKQR
jgi:vacuolar-type H+-ATPase subunit I/STV1